MPHARLLTATDPGGQQENEDFVSATSWKVGRFRYYALVACDGIGSVTGSGDCARQIGNSFIHAAKLYSASRRRGGSFTIADCNNLREQFERSVQSTTPGRGATTIAACLFTRKAAIVLWAGDSRVYILPGAGQVYKITDDHHDAVAELTQFICGDGRIVGGFPFRVVSMHKVQAVLATTDGVHEHCTESELTAFLQYWLRKRISSGTALSNKLHYFLKDSLEDRDNASLALAYWS